MMYLAAFAAMVASDFLYAEYTKAVARGKIFWAAGAAMAMVFTNALVVLTYVSNPWVLLAVAAGAFTGTTLSMRFGR